MVHCLLRAVLGDLVSRGGESSPQQEQEYKGLKYVGLVETEA